VFAEDAWADRKLQGLDPDFEEVVDVYTFGDPEGEEDGVRTDKENLGVQDYYDAFLDVLSSVRGGEIRDMPVSSALGCLEEEARAIDIG